MADHLHGLTTEERELYVAAFGDRKRMDSEFDLSLIPTPSDRMNAIRGNANHCVLAKCAKRCFETEEAVFYHTVAYIGGSKDEDPVAWRFRIPPHVQRAIERFDETGEMPPGGFTLKAPSPFYSLEGRREADRRRGERRKKGIPPDPVKSRASRARQKRKPGLVRSGSGHPELTRVGEGPS